MLGRRTPEQIVRKLHEGERLLDEGKDITEVVRHLEIAESTWNRWRSQYGGMKSVSVGQALIRLRAYAFGNDRPLAGVAEDVVARRLRFDA